MPPFSFYFFLRTHRQRALSTIETLDNTRQIPLSSCVHANKYEKEGEIISPEYPVTSGCRNQSFQSRFRKWFHLTKNAPINEIGAGFMSFHETGSVKWNLDK